MTDSSKPPDGGPPPPPPEAPKFKWLKEAFGDEEAHMMAQASAVGITFAVAIVLGLALGWWLDTKLDSQPWCLLTGLLLGIAAGFKNLFTFSARLDRLSRKKAEGKKRKLPDRLPRRKTDHD